MSNKVTINTSPLNKVNMPNKISVHDTIYYYSRGVTTLKMGNIIEQFCKDDADKTRVENLFKILVPPDGIMDAYNSGKLHWNDFKTWYEGYLAGMDVFDTTLGAELTWLGELMGVEVLTLCCREARDDSHCHRKIIYDSLPKEMQGVRW